MSASLKVAEIVVRIIVIVSYHYMHYALYNCKASGNLMLFIHTESDCSYKYRNNYVTFRLPNFLELLVEDS